MNALTGDDKVAMLLNALAPQAAETVLGRMPAEHASRVRARMKALPPAEPDQVRQAAQEFQDLMRIAERPPPPEPSVPAQRLPAEEPAGPPPEPPADPVPALRECQPDILAAALQGERAATIALVLGCLDIAQASAVLKLLPPELRHDAAARMRQPAPANRDLVHRVLHAVLARCQEAADQPPQPSGDELLTRLAELIRALGRDDRREILNRLELTDPDAAFKVRKQLYRFSDVLKVDDRTLQGILGELNIKTLAVALKNASDEVKNKVLNNVSKRARENVTEEMELLGNVQASQVEQAQDMLVQILQRLDQEGQLAL